MNSPILLAVYSPAPASAPDEKSVASRSDRVYLQWLSSFGYLKEQAFHPKPDSSGHEVQRNKADGRAAMAKYHSTFVLKKIEI